MKSQTTGNSNQLKERYRILQRGMNFFRQYIKLPAKFLHLETVMRQEMGSIRQEMGSIRQEMGSIRQEMDSIEQRDAVMRQEIEALRQHTDNLGETIRQELSALASQLDVMKRMVAGLAQSNIQQRRALLDLEVVQRPSVGKISQNKPSNIKSFDESLAALKSSFPKAFKMWWQILETNRRAYEASPVDHCSVQEHEVARWFSYFMLPYMSGLLLDVGCGPQAIPSYLEGYPVELICGLDPIVPFQPHPFEYVQGIAEFLPWDDDIFDTVVAATSLDHVLSLSMTFEEILRVIKSNGVLMVWQSHVKNAQPYDPLLPDLEPVDQYHLFHFSEEWFKEVVQRWFVIREQLCFDGVSYFYCLTPKV